MYNHRFRHNPGRSTWMRRVLIVIIFIFLLGSSLSACSAGNASQEAAPLSLSALEAQYGLRVNLVAVTAAGGLVDVRLKILDGEKAKSLLQDPDNFPSLWIADDDVSLVVPEENRAQELQFENDGNLFVMFPNGHGIVKPGTPVVIHFGDIQLEPIPAK